MKRWASRILCLAACFTSARLDAEIISWFSDANKTNLDGAGVPKALTAYEVARKPRTSRVQEGSRGNEWLKEGGNADWVYGYDAWQAPLSQSRAAK